uniref:Uncharacterized protein n=1 Tax=Tanacetum cinerariifolium TaxID=118510 RepID=A0A699I5A0_TANCI|nr:hypothetical protein [Tanacetum cinerariifolium]
MDEENDANGKQSDIRIFNLYVYFNDLGTLCVTYDEVYAYSYDPKSSDLDMLFLLPVIYMGTMSNFVEGYQVQLHAYDLSNGHARWLSMSFLGKDIEAIWYSSISSPFFYHDFFVADYDWFRGNGLFSKWVGLGRPSNTSFEACR